MRPGLEDRGIGTILPCCTSQRSAICASEPSLADGDVGENRIAQHASAPERAIGREDQAAPAARLRELFLIEIGMVLGLQVDQRLRTEPDRLVEQRDVEVRNSDMARQALPLGLGERGHRLLERNIRVRPMHQQEIDEVDAEILQALVDRAGEVVGAQIFMRHLGGQRKSRCAARRAARMPSPTLRSVPYFQAVSMWR